MKLILANNHSQKFVNFYQQLQQNSPTPFDYKNYTKLLFSFNSASQPTMKVIEVDSAKALDSYDGIYINGYLPVYELAASVAIYCDYAGISYVNHELHDPPSMSKLTMHAKLAAAGILTPVSLGGAKPAILGAQKLDLAISFPAVLKRADADRGIDNVLVDNWADITQALGPHDDKSIWILQSFVTNNGYYVVSFYNQEPVFSIFRTLEKRPDGNRSKAHFYKPAGGSNASLIDIADLPQKIIESCRQAMQVMNRQIGSVDCLYDEARDEVNILEVNYNPQLVTIETFKDVRVQAFLDSLEHI